MLALKPFQKSELSSKTKLLNTVTRQNNRLLINYLLTGNLSVINLPQPLITPQRQNNLWQDTCFEFFLKKPNSRDYWEFNLAPSGNWNVYHFDDYRQGMQTETAVKNFPFTVERKQDSFSLSLVLNLEPIISQEQTLLMGISTVIKYRSGETDYWALIHPETEADFHSKDSFIIELS